MAFRRGFRRSNFRQNREINLEQAAAYLQEIVSRVKANPDEFEALRKVFKKNVPLTMRSWVAAYLLRNSSGSIAHFGFRKEREENRTERDFSRRTSQREETSAPAENASENAASAPVSAEQPRERFTRVEIAPEQAASIFVGVGRNRRVYPRDLVGLFISVAGIEKDRIGNISVLANYSFVQLYKEDADKAISALNGYNFRGRPLSVSYSRQRDDENAGDEGKTESAPVAAEKAQTIENYENNEPVPNVSNVSAPIADTFTRPNSDTVAEQAAFAKAQAEMTDEEILAARRPRSSSSADVQ